ncbi:MAG: hypothetical protein CBD61_00040 [Pelagibacteraceae bacterium TMED201]|nr:MAG: hypothetical protein CBD61_00040 [Pelagibacteraceae bacterium TMED201]|tara:strand:- start:675 stop:1301 length:627 start_codon:yes stop_codon:yes gene_type:complete
MKKFFAVVLLALLKSTSAHTDNIEGFNIENISIGDSALNYYSDYQLDNNLLDWYNYSYKEYSTSLLPGKEIYDWFKISYKSDDDNYIIEGLVGIIVIKNYEDIKCNKQLDDRALNISKLYKNTTQRKKKLYKLAYNPRKVFQEPNPSGKSLATSISFDFKDGGKIILSCYDMDKLTNQMDIPIKDINQFDTFRIDIRSKVLTNYLEKI